MMHILSQMQMEPMVVKVILGVISELTLSQLHALDQHPVALYSRSLKNNNKDVHDTDCGALPALIHDIGHIFWGNLLSLEERMFLQQELLPALRRSAHLVRKEIGDKKQDMQSAGIVALSNLDHNLNDYNLSAESAVYDSKAKRLYTYMWKTLYNTHSSIYGDERPILHKHLLAELDPIVARLKEQPGKEHLLSAVMHLYDRYEDRRSRDEKQKKRL